MLNCIRSHAALQLCRLRKINDPTAVNPFRSLRTSEKESNKNRSVESEAENELHQEDGNVEDHDCVHDGFG